MPYLIAKKTSVIIVRDHYCYCLFCTVAAQICCHCCCPDWSSPSSRSVVTAAVASFVGLAALLLSRFVVVVQIRCCPKPSLSSGFVVCVAAQICCRCSFPDSSSVSLSSGSVTAVAVRVRRLPGPSSSSPRSVVVVSQVRRRLPGPSSRLSSEFVVAVSVVRICRCGLCHCSLCRRGLRHPDSSSSS